MKTDYILPWGLDYCKCGNIKVEQNPCCPGCKIIYSRKFKIEKIHDRINSYF